MGRVRNSRWDRFHDDWLQLLVGIDRTAKFAFAQSIETADRRTALEFLPHRLGAMPDRVHTILTVRANCTPSPKVREPTAQPLATPRDSGERHPVRRATPEPKHHLFPARALRHDLRSRDLVPPLFQGAMSRGIEHRLTKPKHPSSHEDQKTIRRIVFLNGGHVAHEPNDQRGDRQALPLRQPRPVACPPRRLSIASRQQPTEPLPVPPHLQLCTKAQDPQRPHAVRIRLQNMDIRTRSFHT